MVCVIAFIACDSGDDDFRKVTILLWRIIIQLKEVVLATIQIGIMMNFN